MHFMQLPIKENIQFKTLDSKVSASSSPNNINSNFNSTKAGLISNREVNALGDLSNPLISQVYKLNNV